MVPGRVLGTDLIGWGPLTQAREGSNKELPPGLWWPGPEVGAERVLGVGAGDQGGTSGAVLVTQGKPLESRSLLPLAAAKALRVEVSEQPLQALQGFGRTGARWLFMLIRCLLW